MLFSPDYVGTSDELADQLFEHAGFQRADEVAFALPFTFGADDYTPDHRRPGREPWAPRSDGRRRQ